jgi:TonB family protein
MSETETSKTSAWKAWEGSVVERKFPLKQWLGGSDHSAVFLTEYSSQRAAIKLIAADAADPDQLSRWRVAGQLSHPHLMRIFDSGRTQVNGVPVLYAVMENADDDLAQILPERALAPEEARDLLPPLLDALSYLHGKGLVHGHIRPSNVLAAGDQLKLSSDQVVSPEAVNSNQRRRDLYDAPETAAGIISPACDLWSVGVTLVAALTQNVAFVGEAEQGGPKLPPTIPEPFRGIARECLHLDPRRRCSITEIKARLQPAGRSVPAPAEPPAKKQSAARHRNTLRILIPAAALLVVVFAWSFLHHPTQTAIPGDAKPQVEPSKDAPPVTAPIHSTQPAPINPPPASATPAAPSKTSASLSGAVLHQALPDVPQSARNTITGTVKVSVRVEVDSSGKISSAKLASAGPSKYFARLALQSAEQWEFTPAQKDGEPAASAWLLHFRFRRGGTQASPERLKR